MRLAGTQPLKLVPSRERGPCVRVHAATFGGGLVAGDAVAIEAEVGAGSTLWLGTSAPSKVYRSQGGLESALAVRADVAEGGALALCPAPLACFAGARYRQRIDVALAPGASLLLVETLSAGRSARGERWAFERFDARTRVTLGERLVVHDGLRLEAPAAARFGAVDVVAVAVLAGPRLEAAGRAVIDALAARPAVRREPLRLAASAWPWGVVVRGAAEAVEPLVEAMHALLAPAREALAGGDGWRGPW